MAKRDIIVIGASTGGVEALTTLVGGLPSALPASLFVVCHFPAGSRSVLPEILSRSGPLLASHPADGDPFYPGQIYVAPPDHHLTLAPGGVIRVGRGVRENHHRPAIDPLFRSAARYYGPRVIGVILTGALNDGTAGLMAVRAGGGLAVVQDPDDAVIATMPESAAQLAGVDHVASAAGLPDLLARLVTGPEPAASREDPSDPIEAMPARDADNLARQRRNERRGEVSVMTCPECGGALWQVDDPKLVQFRCHVGHTYGGEALLSEQTEALEAALWTAVRTCREKSVLAGQLAYQERAAGRGDAADRFEEQAEQSTRFGELIRRLLLHAPVEGAETSLRGGPPAGADRPGVAW